jgi:hypothetical protein
MYTHNCKSYFVRPNIHETQEIAVAEGLSAHAKAVGAEADAVRWLH